MANFIYDKGREAFLGALIDWDTDDIRVVACTSSYVPNSATDEFLADISSGYRVASSATLTSPTRVTGIADADDAVFSGISGSAISQLVIYKHTGSDATARLIARLDTYTGLPFTPTGGNLVVIWPNGANKIFKL